MRRSFLVACALGLAYLSGTAVSLAENPPVKSDGKKNAVRHSGTKAIRASLKKPINCDLKEVPLQEAIDYFADKIHIEIVLDLEGLKEEGLDPQKPVSGKFHGLRFCKALDLILHQLHLAWAIHDDVLLIISESVADRFIEIRVYDVADLVTYKDDKGQSCAEYPRLEETITMTVDPASWGDNGGCGSISGRTLGTAKVLVVSQTREVHHDIARLLAKIRAVAAKKSGGDALSRKNYVSGNPQSSGGGPAKPEQSPK